MLSYTCCLLLARAAHELPIKCVLYCRSSVSSYCEAEKEIPHAGTPSRRHSPPHPSIYGGLGSEATPALLLHFSGTPSPLTQARPDSTTPSPPLTSPMVAWIGSSAGIPPTRKCARTERGAPPSPPPSPPKNKRFPQPCANQMMNNPTSVSLPPPHNIRTPIHSPFMHSYREWGSWFLA